MYNYYKPEYYSYQCSIIDFKNCRRVRYLMTPAHREAAALRASPPRI